MSAAIQGIVIEYYVLVAKSSVAQEDNIRKFLLQFFISIEPALRKSSE